MIKRRIYFQLCTIFIVSLVVFTIVVSMIWNYLGHDRFESELFHKTTALATLLLPKSDASLSRQEDAIQKISQALNFEITLWTADRQLIAASGVPAKLPVETLRPGDWISNRGDTQFGTVLPDGRWVAIDLERIAVPNDSYGIGLSLLLLASLISAAVYPFIRYITNRLECLQNQVESIGSGNLSARVNVTGDDEISLLASSFNRAAEKIESLVNAQRLLLANASHELRTPLARIRLGIEMFKTQDDMARRVALQDDIREVDELIDELILMTRLETNIELEKFENTHLMAMAAEECSHYRDCTVTGIAAEINGHPRMLRHLIRNLLDNAYTHGKAPVELSIQENDNAIELNISDSGRGISISESKKVFQPFYRGSDTQNVPGSGLGLALVAKIAKAHGGFVSIKAGIPASVSVIFPQESTTVKREES